MKKSIYQIQIALKGSKPKIWRRILVPSDLLLPDLHKIIQTTMGWTNSHLHQFIKDRTFYTVKMRGDDFWDELNNVDYKKIKISDLLKEEKEKIVYEYDFGDGWEHDLLLEKILPVDEKLNYPVCLAGKMNCPPEDCGGVWGYSDMLEILKQPDHEEYDSYNDWLGEDFDPEHFDKDNVNAMLRTKGYGCISLLD
ncbi:MAG: plasmid pRiA4b ORF-3 family protein [Rikenellaceae bacterium]